MQEALTKTIPKKQVIYSSIWVTLGSFLTHIIRFAGNLILTRLLFPEAFGLMALMTAFMQGLDMFSDLGIGPSIIQNKRGDDHGFLRTAWTVQIIRGIILWGISCLLAWPLAQFYNQSIILALLPIVGFNAILNGFTSTAIFTQNRHLQIKKITIIDIVSQIGGLAGMIAWAWFYPTIWALVFGGLFSSFLKLFLSFFYISGIPHRFQLDKENFHEIFHFGKWIFFSTIFTYISSQGDRLILGKMISFNELGIYSIAIQLATFIPLTVVNISAKIQFPLLSRLATENLDQLKSQLFSTRKWIVSIALIPLCIFAAFGDKIIALLYDSRYHDAGWMFQLLSIGSIGALLESTIIPIYLAMGNSYRHMMLMLAKAIVYLGSLALGAWYYGLYGAVLGVALSNFIFYSIVCYSMKYFQLYPLKNDLIILGGVFLVIGLLRYFA